MAEVIAPPFDLARYSAAVFDLDGTVWLSETPMPGAIEFVDRARAAGLTITFATNATFASVARIHELLVACGLGRPEDAVVTGGRVVARSLAALGVTEVIAEAPPAMVEAMREEGIRLVATHGFEIPSDWTSPSPQRAVVMGASRAATFGNVERIGHLASLGHPLYVTSLDPGFPALDRMEPGGGMLVAAVRALYDVVPIVLGKPSRQYADVVRASVRSDGPIVMFGDSQRADIGTAALLGADGVLVSPSGTVRDDLTRPQYVTAGWGHPIEPFAGHRRGQEAQ